MKELVKETQIYIQSKCTDKDWCDIKTALVALAIAQKGKS